MHRFFSSLSRFQAASTVASHPRNPDPFFVGAGVVDVAFIGGTAYALVTGVGNLVDDTSCGDDPTDPTMIYVEEPWRRLIDANGGPTETNKLTIGSQAINHGKDCTVTVDQRYVPRDGECDIGAYEFTAFTTATLGVNATVNVDPATGFAFLTGTTKCSTNSIQSKPNTMLLWVKLTQEQKGRGAPPTTVYALTSVSVQCGLTSTW